jgi:hypothetical protein
MYNDKKGSQKKTINRASAGLVGGPVQIRVQARVASVLEISCPRRYKTVLSCG